MFYISYLCTFKVTVSTAHVETAFILSHIVCVSRSLEAVPVNKCFLLLNFSHLKKKKVLKLISIFAHSLKCFPLVLGCVCPAFKGRTSSVITVLLCALVPQFDSLLTFLFADSSALKMICMADQWCTLGQLDTFLEFWDISGPFSRPEWTFFPSQPPSEEAYHFLRVVVIKVYP